MPTWKQMAIWVIGWPEISDYIGSRRESEEWNSIPIGSSWDRMKPLGSHTTTDRTNRRQEQEFRKAPKTGGFAGLGKRRGEEVLRVCWTGNRRVRKRVAGMRGDRSGGRGRKPGHHGGELVSARRGHILCPDKGNVHGPAWPRREPTYAVMWWRLPAIFQEAGGRSPWLPQTETVLPVHDVGMELNLSLLPDDAIRGGCRGGVAGRGAPSWQCASPQLTHPDIPARYADGSPSAWCHSDGLSVQRSPDHLTGDAVYSPRLQSHVVLDRPRDTVCVPGREASRLDDVPRQHPADAVAYRPDIRPRNLPRGLHSPTISQIQSLFYLMSGWYSTASVGYITPLGVPPGKISSFLRSVKDYLGLKMPGVYSRRAVRLTPGGSYTSDEIWRSHPWVGAVNLGHRIQPHHPYTLPTEPRHMDRIVRETTENGLHPNVMNRQDGFCLS
jgi:hypothetical protein